MLFRKGWECLIAVRAMSSAAAASSSGSFGLGPRCPPHTSSASTCGKCAPSASWRAVTVLDSCSRAALYSLAQRSIVDLRGSSCDLYSSLNASYFFLPRGGVKSSQAWANSSLREGGENSRLRKRSPAQRD